MDGKKVGIGAIVSVVVGFAVTVMTGFFRTLGSRMGVDFIERGTPLAWNTKVFPAFEHMIWLGFLADFAFWVLVFLPASFLIASYLSRRNPIHQ